MLKIFLVEDESVVRESLRDNIPWEEYGFEFAGEAGDGEMALPMIRKVKPDVLISDIRMPFMDGLSLCHIVGQEFPKMKMIIMSGFDDFEYAKRAVNEGVDQYLSKPITRKSMKAALEEVRDKIESENEQQGFDAQYQIESREYERMQTRNFLENVFCGRLSVEQIYETAGRLQLDIGEPCFNLILFSVMDMGSNNGQNSDMYNRVNDELVNYFVRLPEYILSRWNLNAYCVIVKGDRRSVEEATTRGLAKIQAACEGTDSSLSWYVAAGDPVMRFSALKDCFEKTNHAFSVRFWQPSQHVLTAELTETLSGADPEQSGINSLDVTQVDTSIVARFLESGQADEIQSFTEGYLGSIADVLRSKMFRDYMILNIRFTVMGYVKKLGISQEEFLKALPDEGKKLDFTAAEMHDYLSTILERTLQFRDREEGDKTGKLIHDTQRYIEEHYAEDSLSLNSAAAAVGVSTSYLSATFSKEMNQTFVEYLTKKRMDRAKELLRTQKLHTADVAAQVGYKDPHYFSYVFRKTQGCTPKEYRTLS